MVDTQQKRSTITERGQVDITKIKQLDLDAIQERQDEYDVLGVMPGSPLEDFQHDRQLLLSAVRGLQSMLSREEDFSNGIMNRLESVEDNIKPALQWIRNSAHQPHCMKLDIYDERDHGCTCGRDELLVGVYNEQ